MRSFIYYSMVVLMVLWTALFVLELAYLYANSPAIAALGESGFTLTDLGQFYDRLRLQFWSINAGARVAVWALPMIVFAIVTAVTQPEAR